MGQLVGVMVDVLAAWLEGQLVGVIVSVLAGCLVC